jgi:hypothetical protein
MKLLEIQREIKNKRKFREGNYAIIVDLENPGDEFQEFLKVQVLENDQPVARAIFKQWKPTSRWEPLSITFTKQEKKKSLQEMIYNAATNAGFFLKD